MDEAQAIPEQAQPKVEETTPVYDISGKEPVLGDMPHDKVQEAIASGNFSFPKGREINVVSPDGSFGTLLADKAPEAFKSGYQYATPQMLGAQAEKEHYNSPAQKALGLAEGVAEGFAGPIATGAEDLLSRAGVPGISAEERVKRQDNQPLAHGIYQAVGFGAGMLTGVGEASLLAHAGEAVAGGLKLGLEGSSLGSRLAAGAAKMATEMTAYQAGDELTKAINQDPNQTVASAAANIGFSGLLGGGLGFGSTGLGIAAKSAINSQVLQDFADRLAFRGANLNPNEMMQHELTQGINSFDQIGDEVNGVSGIKAQSIAKLLPDSVTPEISSKLQDMGVKGQIAIQKMIDKDVPPRLLKDFQGTFNKYLETATEPNASVGDHFDALNQFKQDVQDYSKGRWGLNAVQRTAEDYQFVNITKELSHELRTGLEDPKVWGEAADVQKSINQAWKDAIPAVKDVTKKFMSKVGNEYVIDPQKFVTYVNQNGKATTSTIRQQMMGKFVEAMDQFHQTVGDISAKAGIENPISPISLNSLKESIELPSTGSKLGDIWYDKLGATGLGNAAGALTGGALGSLIPIPGATLGGVYLGKEILGPAFASIIKPLLEKGASMPAFQSSMAYFKSALAGEHALTNATKSIFESGMKTVPSHLWHDDKDLENLDDKLKKYQQNPGVLLDMNGNMDKYLPEHAQAAAQTAMNAVAYLNNQRPINPKANPLDSDIPISKAQKSSYYRTLSIAEQPLSVFEHIKKSTLLPQDIQTLKAIYPAYYPKMSQQLTNAMMDHITKGETIPYRIRQSMSMFLGQPLDSTMLPQNMQTVQALFASKGTQQQQGQPASKNKKNTSKLGEISEGMKTTDQARQERAMRS